MELTQATLGVCIVTSIFGSSALCYAAGFRLRARLERGIRREYRELFGACRRSMAHANEYRATPEHALELAQTRKLRRPPPIPSGIGQRALTAEHDLRALAKRAEVDFSRVLTTEVDDAV